MIRNRLQRLLRAYPTLNLNINVTNSQGEADIVLPGLRFDDIAHTGQPDIWRIYDMVNRVEHAALYADYPFLDFKTLTQRGLGILAKAVQVRIRESFYEHTTPKAPLQVQLKLVHIGKTTFTTQAEVCCGGRSKPSIIMLNMYTLMHMESMLVEEIPDWWRKKLTHAKISKDKLFSVDPIFKPYNTFFHSQNVPLVDTDTDGRTRCASYVRYFLDNASIASQRGFYDNIFPNYQDFHIKNMSLLYYQPSSWGDPLKVETWEDNTVLRCQISLHNQPVWSGEATFHSHIEGLPDPVLKNQQPLPD